MGIIRFLKNIAIIVVCGVLFAASAKGANAQTLHENPDKVQQIFSGISLFQYHTTCLDLALMKRPGEVDLRLEKMPFASIPPELSGANENLSGSAGEIAHLIAGISDKLALLRTYLAENRLDEASETVEETTKMLSQSTRALRIIETATESLGNGFKVSTAPPESILKSSYDALWQKIKEINDFIDLSKKTLDSLISQPKSLINTQLTLSAEPNSVFVGENIFIEGSLTALGAGLNNRKVDILMGGSKYLTVTTDANGRYQSIVTIPYEYIPEQEIQALYLPEDEDLEVYASSISLPVKIAVLYYKTKITLDIPEQVYPGISTNLAGKFNYGGAPTPESRLIEIYIDDIFMSRDTVGEEFTVNITLDQSISLGKHVLTIAAQPMMRYSPVVATEYINVIRFIPLIEIELPGVLVGPGIISEPRTISIGGVDVALGGLSAKGRVWSEISDLKNVSIEITLGDSKTQITPNADGTFSVNIEAAMGFMLFGSQELEIKVLPQEPWYAPLNITRSLLMINVITCSATIIILVSLGILLSLRIRKGIHREKIPVAVRIVPREITPVYTVEKVPPVKGRTVKNRIIELYMGIVRLVLRITHTTLKPEQTIREFSQESSSFLGPVAKYFMEFTRLIEKLVYSSYEPSGDDSKTGQKLSENIKRELKDEVI